MKETTHPERQYTARSIARTESKRKPPTKTKGTRFDTLVGRYYSAVYSFASRLTDDPREATLLTHEAFDRLRKPLRTCRDENVLASILMSLLIRAGLGTA
jgi:DNA-directed RNA polymerase specialized sigma24 family protein